MGTKANPGIEFDESWIKDVNINFPAVKKRAESFPGRRSVKKDWQIAWLLRVTRCIDLTTLAGNDTATNVQRLCLKAKWPFGKDLLELIGCQDLNITCGAVCVYPNRVEECKHFLKQSNIAIASVATGFPAGQTPLSTRLTEIKFAVEKGATEIDVVLNRHLALAGNWKGVYDEVKEMKAACGEAHMKVILATGDLGSLTNVYKASIISMMAGADFIKTSTGKEEVNAVLPVAFVMVRAIRDYHKKTGVKVGFKPAGGIRNAKDALLWLSLVKDELGDEWTHPTLFRIGASGLLLDIERQIYHNVTGHYAALHELPMA